MKLSLLSKYRTELMGIAILNVILFHLGDLNPIREIWSYGYLGVDVFLLLSGMGLVYSWKKDNKISSFYKKRFERIIPTYLLIEVVYLSIKVKLGEIPDIKAAVYMMTGMNFWKYSDRTFWYIYAICVLYLIFPLIMKVINARNKEFFNFKLLLIFVYILVLIISVTKLNYLMIFITRIPVFILGIYIGNSMENAEKKADQKLLLASFIVGWILLYIRSLSLPEEFITKIGMEWIPLILVVFPGCMYIAFLFEKLKENYIFEMGKRLITLIGKYSLEIYLVHALLFMFDKNIEKLAAQNQNVYVVLRNGKYGLYIIISIIMAILVNKLIKFCFMVLNKNRIVKS